MKKDRLYIGVIISMLTFFLIFSSVSHRNFIGLVEVNDSLIATIENQRLVHRTQQDKWESEYSTLLKMYDGVSLTNDKLRERLNEVENEVELPVYEFTEEEIYLLAQCVEAEAGHYEKHKNSQRYVAQVILNRLHSGKFPNSIKEVIYQKRGSVPQFSVAYNGMINREVEPETLANVYSAIVNGTDMPEYVCYFYSASVKENWVNTLPTYKVVEGTVFAYEDKEDY